MLFPMSKHMYRYISTFRNMSPIWLFSVVPLFRALPVCCSGTFWMMSRRFQLPLLLLVSLSFLPAHKLHFYWVLYILKSFRLLSWSYFLSPKIAVSLDTHFPVSLSLIMKSGLLSGTVLSVRSCFFHHIVTLLHSWLVSTDFGTCSYQRSWSSLTPISLLMLKCNWSHTCLCIVISRYWTCWCRT